MNKTKSDITYDNKYIYGQKTITNCPSQDMCPGKNAREKTNNNENADSQAELSESNKSMFEREREREREMHRARAPVPEKYCNISLLSCI